MEQVAQFAQNMLVVTVQSESINEDLLIELVIFLAIFLGFNVPLLLLRQRAIEEVHRFTDDEFSAFMWSGASFRLWREHKRYLPASRKRIWYWGVTGLAIAWMFLGLSLIQTTDSGFRYLLQRIFPT